MKTLYFEGAGWSGADSSKATIGNCRIRTAFHLDNGKAVYLEILCGKQNVTGKNKVPPVYYGYVDSLHYITDDDENDDENKHSILPKGSLELSYTLQAILDFVNSLGASFDAVAVVPDLGGYRVFRDVYSKKGTERVNYGDEFQFDPDLTARRDAIHNAIFAMEKEDGKEYPNFSLWVDESDPKKLHLLRHFIGYNKHWEIDATMDDWKETMVEAKLGRYGC